MTHANDLFDAAQIFGDLYPIEPSLSDKIKKRELLVAVYDLGVISKGLAIEVEGWKKGYKPVLSKLGVELQLLNELYATIESTMLFFMRENIELPGFSLDAVKQAYIELRRCNKLLPN